MSARHVLLMLTCLALSACASKFPSPEWAVHAVSSPNGVEIFTNTFNTHGGESLDQLNDVNVSITGKWKKLIRKIQPLVTDFNYRVDSQERLLPKARIYAFLLKVGIPSIPEYSWSMPAAKILSSAYLTQSRINGLPALSL